MLFEINTIISYNARNTPNYFQKFIETQLRQSLKSINPNLLINLLSRTLIITELYVCLRNLILDYV